MAANTSPIFVLTPNIGQARTTEANTASDGSGNLLTLFTAATNGSRVDNITIRNSQTTAAASAALVVRVFLTDTGGANPKLLEEVAVPAATRSTTAIGTAASITFPGGLFLKSGQILKACASVFAAASQVDITAKGYDY